MQAHHQHEAQVTSSPPNAELKIKAGNSDDRKKQSSELTLALALALTLALALALVVVVDVVVVVMMVVVVMVGIAESEMETESVSNHFQIKSTVLSVPMPLRQLLRALQLQPLTGQA